MSKFFTTKRIVGVAVFAALSYAISFLEFPIFPAASFLKLDFSSVFTLLGGFIYGPVSAIIISGIKELICFFTKSSSGGVGELANFILTTSFVLVPAIAYYFKKGFKVVIPTLIVGCVIQTAAALVVNRYINFPLYMGNGAEAVFTGLWQYIVFFNLIKTVAISVIVLLIYKRISILIKKISFTNAEKSNIIGVGEYFTKNCKQTEKLGFDYAKTLTKGDIVVLEGDLGAGKTVFVKGAAKCLGVTDTVTSPTYAYLNVYGNKVYHYDCYRLSSGLDAERLGLTDYFNGDNICFIEWAENIKDVLPKTVKTVKIEKLDGEKRKISIS